MKSKYKLALTLTAQLILAVTGWTLYSIFNSQFTHSDPKASTIPKSNPETHKIVTALGRILPKDKVISVSASSELPTIRVAKLLVREGDKVQRGQTIATLDNHDRLQAALEQAQQKVKVAQARLSQVSAGQAKQGEIKAQEAYISSLNAQFSGEVSTHNAKIARLKTELRRQTDALEATNTRLKAEWEYAKAECDRYQILFKDGVVSASIRDSKCLEMESARGRLYEGTANKNRIEETLIEQINEAEATLHQILSTFPKQISEAKANLSKITEVRPVDIQVTQAELKQAISSVTEAQANLESAYVRVPFDGQILEINTFPGEKISSAGIVDLAQTQEMYVVAEIYETEINKIRIGQKATVSSSALKNKLQGTVEKIGLEVGKKEVLNNDPTLDVDARIVEVKIRLNSNDSQEAARLINLEVEVEVNIST